VKKEEGETAVIFIIIKIAIKKKIRATIFNDKIKN